MSSHCQQTKKKQKYRNNKLLEIKKTRYFRNNKFSMMKKVSDILINVEKKNGQLVQLIFTTLFYQSPQIKESIG